MKLIRLHTLIASLLLIGMSPSVAYAEKVTKNDVTMTYSALDDGRIMVTGVENRSDKLIMLSIDGVDSKCITVNAGTSVQVNQYAEQTVKFDYAKNSGAVLWQASEKQKEVVSPESDRTGETSDVTDAAAVHAAPSSAEHRPARTARRAGGNASETYLELMNNDEFFGIEAVETYVRKADAYAEALSASADKNQFIIDHDLKAFLLNSIEEIDRKREEIPQVAREIVSTSKATAISNPEIVVKYVVETLNNRLRDREDAYDRLNDLVSGVQEEDARPHPLTLDGGLVNYAVVAVIFLILLIWIIVAISKKKKSRKEQHQAVADVHVHQDDANQAIVVRRRTTSILKKQSLEDVVDNPAYLVVETSDFVQDSAVRRIYVKNSCIKDIYNLYAEDLRNADNPKEDGCMVLGRWVYDEAAHVYDISMEIAVFPGDDAVFKEYELNFGGKIKLRIAEKLRKLRRDTNLQYDLTCWIHSHPGLGVFFSNSDSNVQMQLKHAQHPNFLVAFVVDILTSDQELGIFTFRKDGTINSRGDLTRMYSLETMYKWALESERKTFVPENYCNVLENARARTVSCYGIELNNNAIIDMVMITEEAAPGLAGWAVGFTADSGKGKEYVISGIVRDSEKPAAGIQGCLVCITHMSLPTIQRLVASESTEVNFVLVYSSRQMTLTSIPVINGEVVTDESFYGDVNVDDLKIWTRRKR